MLPFRLLCLLVVSLFIVTPLRAQDGTLTVDASAELGPISPYIYGANYGPWALVSLDMMPAAEQAGVTHLRFPAGNWGDLNDITPFQLDMFMSQARLFGSEPSISVRLDQGTPEQAAELVRYANIEKGYGIRYWSIGNEPDLFTDYTVEELNREWRAIALAMEAVDPSIILIGPEVSQYPPLGRKSANIHRLKRATRITTCGAIWCADSWKSMVIWSILCQSTAIRSLSV